MRAYELDPKECREFRGTEVSVKSLMRFNALFEESNVGFAVFKCQLDLVDAVRLGAFLREGLTAIYTKDVGRQYISCVVSMLLTPHWGTDEVEYQFISGELLDCWVDDELFCFKVLHSDSNVTSIRTIVSNADACIVLHLPVAGIAHALTGGAL